MKPYKDKSCGCFIVEDSIRNKFPDADWNLDDACDAWRELSSGLQKNNIEFDDFSDEEYGCTCPTCGRMICGWCV